MGNRTIRAPGVEIIEHDLSGYTTTNLGTGCLITGFAQKGEDLEPIHITNRSSWLLNFGAPTNEAEEYFYNAGMEVLNQGGFLYAAKIPYANDVAGIYAAAKFNILKSQTMYSFDEDTGTFYDETVTNEDGELSYVKDDSGVNCLTSASAEGRFIKNYSSLKELGINHLSLIAPSGQDFLSKDLVDEYETGESQPASNVIYLVDKTRAVYTRTTEIADRQEKRDPRYCIGIVPVISTICNTAYFQNKSTGVKSDVPELYQPVRSLRTIEFPAGAASAAEYKPTTFVASDLHTQLMKDSSTFSTSLSERAATIAQSCLVNGNLVDGKFKPFVGNDIAVVVFKAFVSTEDGKVDFEPVETFVGSLDPMGRNEKGLTTFIDTIINNNSEYIYCFSNLENPQQVLNPDHGFVAGSDYKYEQTKNDLLQNTEYQSASLFSAYVANMLGFGNNTDIGDGDEEDTPSLPAPREDSEYYLRVMSALTEFYNSDAKIPVCNVNQLTYGGTVTYKDMSSGFEFRTPDITSDDVQNIKNALESAHSSGWFAVSNKLLTTNPEVSYTIVDGDDGAEDVTGEVKFELEKSSNAVDSSKKPTYEYEDYDMKMTFPENVKVGLIAREPLSELTILNSTDYLRAIYDFTSLVDFSSLNEQDESISADTDITNEVQLGEVRRKCIQSLVVNSILKSGRYRVGLRQLVKAAINIDKLDLNFANAISNRDAVETKIGEKYVNDIYQSYFDIGVLSQIKFQESDGSNSDSPSGLYSLSRANDALEEKLDEIVNINTTKEEKMNPRNAVSMRSGIDDTLVKKYAILRLYLLSQYWSKKADLMNAVMRIIHDCCYAQQRFIESQRNINDASIMLGFYPEMAEPIITYTTIAQSLNKILDSMSNIHESDIDVVCDAGISNIAQFVKQVYDPSSDDGEDVGGLYQPVKYSSSFKFNKNTDLAYWKTIIFKYDTFCKFRGDCMFCADGPRGMVLIGNKQVVRKSKKDTSIDLNILPYLSKIAGINTSYGAGYLNWYRTISDYTGDTLWVPPSIKAMGTYILTDKQYNWWDAPAGMRRGVINMVETSFNPNRVQAGEIYDVNWNYAIHYLNDGIIQEGQKTFQTRQSALDRVNVRRLIGRIKRYVYFASRQFLYEPHTAAIREKYVKTLEPFFQDLVNRGGLYDYKIICDSSNNTPEVIDRNELRVKIGIKPVKTIEFIIIDLCVLNTGASWTEMDAV